MGPILHGLHADLVPSTTADADGFIPLEGAMKWAVAYTGPGPPKPSAAHRYTFLVFEQPESIDTAKLRSLFGWREDVGIFPRVRWDQEAFVTKTGLGPLVASNFFLCQR
ncbi:phosphatidylethanolamine-binding protein [Xylariaceae sp. FL0255]|nr:phosphatidylethanolamine-binding protein [Xylariaceae sp. FL0255]